MAFRLVFAGIIVGAATSLAAGAQTEPALDTAAAALETYVERPDSTFGWRVLGRDQRRGTELVELHLTSQTWRGIDWKHQLVLIRPARVSDPTHGVLIIGGGRWRDGYETAASALAEDEAKVFVAIAERMNAIVAVVGQVPFQPMFDRREDELVAYTFERYLETGDPEWPLLLPMVKSAVRAMDASAAAAAQEWGPKLETFTVLGGSKRGWTTWLTAAVDRRVTAAAPVVIDALNMARHFPYQTETWSEPSEEIRPYTELHLDQVLGSADGAALRRIVDPFDYRAAIPQPKLIVLATNDRFFPVDAANLYWDDLLGPKYLLYLPNDEHSISDYRRLIPSLRALHQSVETGVPLPRVEWEYLWSGEAPTLCVRADPAPARVRVWRSASDNRDFRDAVWESWREQGRAASYTFPLGRPETGYAGVFAEVVFGRGRSAFSLSTNLAVLAASAAADYGPRPRGTQGVCARSE